MPLPHLSIGTSDNRINLLGEEGFTLDGWEPGGTEYGTIFQESQLADFRQMAAYRDVTVFDTLPLKLRTNSQDTAGRAIQDMRSIIRLCLDFWTTTWQTSVVYLSARASCETNMRHAVVHDARLVGESSPFGQPFVQAGGGAVMDTLNLIVERGPWLENEPGTGTAVSIGATQTYDGRTVGNVDDTGTADPTTAAQTVFVANKHNVAQLTDVWYWDESALGWTPGGNLMDVAIGAGFAFMPPAPLQVDDFVIFGIDTGVADSGPFSSLVFDIGTAIGVGTGITVEWRYYQAGADTVDPSTWTPLNVQDNTNAAGAMTGDAFDTTGINSVHWEQPTLWGAIDPDPGAANLGITGYWMCAYVKTVVGGVPSPPEQDNRDIYTVTWPYIEFEASEIGGDMPALLRLSVDSRSAQDGIGTTTNLWCQRLIAGLRACDRGANFTSFINLSNEQNNTDITIALGVNTIFDTWGVAPTGIASRYAAGGVEAMATRVYVRVTPDWYGRFHAFVRAWGYVGSSNIQVRLGYAPADSAYPAVKVTRTRQLVSVSDNQLLDFGEIVLGPATSLHPLEVSHTYLEIQAGCDNAAGGTIYFYDLILIPIDEWAIDAEDVLKNSGALGYTNDYWSHWEGDGIRNQRNILSNLIGTVSGKIARYWRPITNGLPILQTGKKQRLWFLHARYDDYADVDDLRADSEIASTIQIWKQQRYTSLRGDR